MSEMMFYGGAISGLFFFVVTLFSAIVYNVPRKCCYMLKSKGYLRFEKLRRALDELCVKIENEDRVVAHKILEVLIYPYQQRYKSNTSKLECNIDDEELWSLETTTLAD